LKRKNLHPKDIDIIAFGSMFYSEVGKNEIKYRFTKNRLDKSLEIIDRLTAYMRLSSKKISAQNKKVFLEQLHRLGYKNAKILFFNHHLSHAISAFYCAPFKADLIITCDGHGDGESFNFYAPGKGRIPECIVSNNYETSVGQFYSAITKLLGFRPTRHEGKITGLAAYGKPTELVSHFEKLFYYENDRLKRFPAGIQKKLWAEYKIDRKISLKGKINMKFSESDIGHRYAVNAWILQAWLEDVSKGFSKEDIAYACQHTAEKVVLDEIKRVYKTYMNGKSLKVVLAGGVFANVRINQKIYDLDFMDNIFIQPAMGDSGLALGAAILADIEKGNRKIDTNQYQFENTYWGPDYANEVENAIASLNGNGWKIKKLEHPAKGIAKLLASNKIIGFWHGPMEWGPRALGRRSILLNTFDRSVNDTLNKRLNRTEFMPFAPVVLDFKATEYFPKYNPDVPAGDYMTITYDTEPQYAKMLQAVVHVDGTARPQVIRMKTNPFYYDVLHEFYKLTGCGALVNTSFNAHEEPIVSSPEVALNALRSNRIDVLVLDDNMIMAEAAVATELAPNL